MAALKEIEQFYNTKIDELPMNIADLCREFVVVCLS
jgi:hypothetical protein